MSQHTALKDFIVTGEEAVTYVYDPEREIIGYLNLGSAEIHIVKDSHEETSLIVTTSSGESAIFPAALFCQKH